MVPESSCAAMGKDAEPSASLPEGDVAETLVRATANPVMLVVEEFGKSRSRESEPWYLAVSTPPKRREPVLASVVRQLLVSVLSKIPASHRLHERCAALTKVVQPQAVGRCRDESQVGHLHR